MKKFIVLYNKYQRHIHTHEYVARKCISFSRYVVVSNAKKLHAISSWVHNLKVRQKVCYSSVLSFRRPLQCFQLLKKWVELATLAKWSGTISWFANYYIRTDVWKFHDFSITQILREINFGIEQVEYVPFLNFWGSEFLLNFGTQKV